MALAPPSICPPSFLWETCKNKHKQNIKVDKLTRKRRILSDFKQNGYSRKKLKRIKPIGNFAFKKGFYKRGAPTPWNYKILRRDRQRERERERYVHEILKQNQNTWQTKENISKLSVNILGQILYECKSVSFP